MLPPTQPPAAETQATTDFIAQLEEYNGSSDSEGGQETLNEALLMADVENALAPPEVSWL